MGFVDPAFVQRCGAQVRPSSRRIILADGSEVRAAGEVTLTYSLRRLHVRAQGGHAAGALHVDVHRDAAGAVRAHPRHRLAGAAPRAASASASAASSCASTAQGRQQLHPPAHALQRRRQRGAGGGTAAAQGHHAEARVQADAQGQVAAAVRGADRSAVARRRRAARDRRDTAVPGSDHPLIAPLLEEFASTVFGEPKPGVPRKRGVEHAIQLHAGHGAAARATAAPPEREGRGGDEGVRRGRPEVRASCSRRPRPTAAWR